MHSWKRSNLNNLIGYILQEDQIHTTRKIFFQNLEFNVKGEELEERVVAVGGERTGIVLVAVAQEMKEKGKCKKEVKEQKHLEWKVKKQDLHGAVYEGSPGWAGGGGART